ncbi:MAG: universal stress protein [Ferruginibacter sp.]
MINYHINKILVAVDFTAASLNALDTAIAMANRHSASLLLVNVVETSGLSWLTAEPETCLTGTAMQYSVDQLQALQHSIKDKYITPCDVISVSGAVSMQIAQISREQNVDIIVLGTHGLSGYKEHVIGSNAFNIIKNAGCPVLTIPENRKYESFKNILFPVRPVAHALQKYDFIQQMVKKDEATLKVLGLSTNGDDDIVLVKSLTAQLKEKIKVDHVYASTYCKVGENMEEEVLKIASLMNADLIVLTAGIDSLYNKRMVGHYTKHVINHAHLPVLCIRPVEENIPEELEYESVADWQ